VYRFVLANSGTHADDVSRRIVGGIATIVATAGDISAATSLSGGGYV
jgi:hypothetical protein